MPPGVREKWLQGLGKMAPGVRGLGFRVRGLGKGLGIQVWRARLGFGISVLEV